jgi:alpha-tubulin suppressor-like RCC1 family protein
MCTRPFRRDRPWTRTARAWPSYACVVLAGLAAACDQEFPDQPTATLTLQVSPDFRDTLTNRDTASFSIQISNSRDEKVTGIEVEWQSSDSAVLELRRLQPSPPTRENSLTSQLTVQAIAHTRGTVVVTATVGGQGFDRAELKETVTVLERWRSISAGASHTCAIAVDSLAYCWGAGQAGALGTGLPLDAAAPHAVLAVGDIKFASISAGDDNTCGVIAQGVIYCWGTGLNGRLGNGDPSGRDNLTPAPVVGGLTFQSVAAGRSACGIASDFTALCWGDDNFLQLGVDAPPLDTLDRCDGVLCSLTPRAVTSNPNSYSLVDVGGIHTCAVSRSPAGQALCWGTAPRGGLGAGPDIASSETPIEVSGGLQFKSISAGGEHTCGLTLAGDLVYCWGNNNHGQLGDGSPFDRSEPVLVQGSLKFEAVSAGRQHTCALTTGHEAYCWGQGFPGQLGNGSVEDASTPTAVSGGLVFASLSAGDSYTCGVTPTGAAYCWGGGAFGRLGNGSVEDIAVPTRITEPE